MLSNSEESSDLIRQRYQNEIDVFPPELQTATGVLYAVVRSVVLHSAVSDNDVQVVEAHDSHHFIEGGKLSKLQTLGPDTTFSSLIQQVNEEIACTDNTATLEVSDVMGMRMAKARLFMDGLTGCTYLCI
jgi:hypothetical protein